MTLTHRPISCGCIPPRVCPGRTAVHHTQHYPPRPQCPLCDRDGGGDDGGDGGGGDGGDGGGGDCGDGGEWRGWVNIKVSAAGDASEAGEAGA